MLMQTSKQDIRSRDLGEDFHVESFNLVTAKGNRNDDEKAVETTFHLAQLKVEYEKPRSSVF